MRNRLLMLSALACLALASGCESSGIGSPCTAPPGAGNLKVVLGSGECTTSVCVSYLGSSGYCSVECDDQGQCPAMYLCCPVVQTGPTNSCTTDADCVSSHTCRQSVCRPRQYCVQASGACQ